jgi:hypothetical protein
MIKKSYRDSIPHQHFPENGYNFLCGINDNNYSSTSYSHSTWDVRYLHSLDLSEQLGNQFSLTFLPNDFAIILRLVTRGFISASYLATLGLSIDQVKQPSSDRLSSEEKGHKQT